MGVFDEIYKNNIWGFGSGHGSLPSVTKGYRKYLETFIRENNIRSIVDMGCGDWQFSRLIDWCDATYIGLDVVPAVIDQNNNKYGTGKISFKVIEPGTALPKADLLIVKDVLQHLSDEMVHDFIKKSLPGFKHALITNCILPKIDINKSINNGEFRPLDLRQAPFNLKATTVYTFTGPRSFAWKEKKFFPAWKKLVLHVG